MFRLLIVEDNQADADLLLECLRAIDARCTVASNGRTALTLLRTNLQPWDLVILDLNLPGMKGYDVLREIRSDDAIRLTPVIIMSHSSVPEDVVATYQLGANCYIQKPATLAELRNITDQIESFWLRCAQLPSQIAF
jgi:two-component system, chemotaxis family, response regulator Rcp1